MNETLVCCKTVERVDWLDWSTCPFSDDLSVFRLSLATEVDAGLLTILQPDELKRAERFRWANDRNRFVYGRLLAKTVLGKIVGQEPTAIRLVPGFNKKPFVEGYESVHMNLSHAGEWITMVVGKTAVGVDLEKVADTFSFDTILSASFGPEEQNFITGSSNPREQFYRLWTRKEALIKATAKGIDDDFYRIPSLDGAHTMEASLLENGGCWTVASFSVADNHPAAVAYRSDSENLKFYTVDSVLFARN